VRAFRWFLVLPASFLASFVVFAIMAVLFALVHGFDKMTVFWDGADMVGMWVSGTYIILIARGTQAAAATYVAARVAPSHSVSVARISIGLIVVAGGATISYLLIRLSAHSGGLTFSSLYRILLEYASLCLGALLAYTKIRNQTNDYLYS
jgi:hypothetical protein